MELLKLIIELPLPPQMSLKKLKYLARNNLDVSLYFPTLLVVQEKQANQSNKLTKHSTMWQIVFFQKCP